MTRAGLWSCVDCGYEARTSSEVKVTLTEYDDPIPIEVAIPVGETQRGAAGMEYQRVPGRYGAVPRCTDRSACAARMKANAVDEFFEGVGGSKSS